MSNYTPEQVEAIAAKLADSVSIDNGRATGPVAAPMLYAYAATLRQQAGRVDEDEGFDPRKFVRHMAEVLEAGGDMFKIDADLARLGAAIQAALAQNTQGDAVDPTDPGHDVDTLRNHVRVLEHRIRDLHAERARVPENCRSAEVVKWLRTTAHELHMDPMDCCGPRANHPIAYALDDLADYLAAAPSQRAEVK